jgi:hypothetical protein
MAKRNKTLSTLNKGHVSLKRYNALYLFSTIIDENIEHETETVVRSICSKFDIDYNENYFHLESLLSNIIIESGGYSREEEIYWENEIEGTVQVMYEYSQYSYISSSGVKHSVRFDEAGYLIVNSKVVEEFDWDSHNMQMKVEEIKILFSFEIDDTQKDYMHYFNIAWSRFEKGEKWATRDQMLHAAFMIFGYTPDLFSDEYHDASVFGAKFITQKWFMYLWECKEKNLSYEFTLSLKSFISKNQDSWSQHKENKVIVNRIYTTEHEEIRKIIASEPDVKAFKNGTR